MNVDFPYAVDGRGRTAVIEDDPHIRDMIEQVLFTSPGERVNRPTFGCGLLELVFEPNSEELAAATQLQVHGALQQWLGDVIEVQDVTVTAVDAQLTVTVIYLVRETQQHRLAEFRHPEVAP
jgi:phage baseplate assembly protein W